MRDRGHSAGDRLASEKGQLTGIMRKRCEGREYLNANAFEIAGPCDVVRALGPDTGSES
jgi:hypothetical protein